MSKLSSVQILSGATATGDGEVHKPVAEKMVFQASGTTSSGSGSASIIIYGSLDGTNYAELGTISLTLGTAATNDAFAVDAPWVYVKANVSAISGTGASVDAYMAVRR